MRPQTYFIAGTDTGVGKTLVSCALLQAALAQGLSTAAVKPVAAGAEHSAEGWRNDDALALWQHCSVPLRYEQLNPVCLQAAIAPHIAAAHEGKILSLESLVDDCRQVMALEAGLTLIEGAGGWLVPINDEDTLADLVSALQVPVVLVVGLRLGCLNHALLSARAMHAAGISIAGWVANHVEADMPEVEQNVQTLQRWLPAPMLAEMPHCPDGALPVFPAAGLQQLLRL